MVVKMLQKSFDYTIIHIVNDLVLKLIGNGQVQETIPQQQHLKHRK